jgi:hypothetical protein
MLVCGVSSSAIPVEFAGEQYPRTEYPFPTVVAIVHSWRESIGSHRQQNLFTTPSLEKNTHCFR